MTQPNRALNNTVQPSGQGSAHYAANGVNSHDRRAGENGSSNTSHASTVVTATMSDNNSSLSTFGPNFYGSDERRSTRQANPPYGAQRPFTMASFITPEMTGIDREEMGLVSTRTGNDVFRNAHSESQVTAIEDSANSASTNNPRGVRDNTVSMPTNSTLISQTPDGPTRLQAESDAVWQNTGTSDFTTNGIPETTEPASLSSIASVSMANFMVYSSDGYDIFNTPSPAPVTVAVDGQPNCPSNTPEDMRPDMVAVMATNGNSTLAREDQPTRLSDYLRQDDPATQERWGLEWRAALSGDTSDPIRRPGTPLPTGDVVYVEDVRLSTPDIERLATLAPFSEYPDERDRGASNTTLADGRTLDIQENGFPIESGPTRTEAGVNNRNRRARTHVGTLRRTTPEETQAFFGEFSDSENDRVSNVN